MTNYYEILGVRQNSSTQDIIKAFREKAKRLHPDIAGDRAAGEMRKILTAYEILSDRDRRFDYDRAYSRFTQKYSFDYRSFLMEQGDDPASQAKLVFFELLHAEEDAALSVWDSRGGPDFPIEQYLDREDWMDCTYILAEELHKRERYHDAFLLLAALVREERRRPYFRHFAEDIEIFLKELVRLKLHSTVDDDTYIECLEIMLDLGFSSHDEARWLRSIAETFIRMGETRNAEKVFREALRRDPGLPNIARLRKKLNVNN
jgi:tetratricopeptide (TPR) repeat protein